MLKNESTVDRVVRGVVGAILVLWALFTGSGNTVLWVIALVVGLVLLATAAVGFCPIYRAFGFSTKKKA